MFYVPVAAGFSPRRIRSGWERGLKARGYGNVEHGTVPYMSDVERIWRIV
jgi:hypothetical protein